MDELQMIVVREQQRTYRQEAAEDRLARHIDPVVAPVSVERTVFGRETAAVGYDCCVASAERAG